MKTKHTLESNSRVRASAGLVAQFLNTARGLPKQKRVLDMLGMCTELSQMSLQHCATGERVISPGPDFGKVYFDLRKNPRAHRLVDDLNKMLRRYTRGFHAVGLSLATAGQRARWESNWAPLKIVPFSKRERGTTIEQGYAIELILSMLAENGLGRLRQCSCGLWFAARVRKQTACGEKCRRKRYESGDAYKARRRAYSRTYYREHLSKQ